MTYRHCLLTRGTWSLITWIPDRLATAGQRLVVDGTHMQNGMRTREDWIVSRVYGTATPEELAYTLNAQAQA